MGKNKAKVKLEGFKEMITVLDSLGGNLVGIAEDALSQAGETIGWDTLDAAQDPNMPAEGKYSTGRTEQAVLTTPRVEVSGNLVEVGAGFDYTKDGAGGILITGTPKMKPNYELQKIFKGRRYMDNISKDIEAVVQDEIERRLK